MARRPLPDIAYVREALDYDPDTGVFLWRTRPLSHFPHAMAHRLWNAKWAGKLAGNVKPHGYLVIVLSHQPWLAHRLAWGLINSKEPFGDLDHINGDQRDNRIANLRLASPFENSANRRTRRDSHSGITGVKVLKTGRRRFLAYIGHHHRHNYLGVFATLEEAVTARREAEQRLYGEFARKGISS